MSLLLVFFSRHNSIVFPDYHLSAVNLIYRIRSVIFLMNMSSDSPFFTICCFRDDTILVIIRDGIKVFVDLPIFLYPTKSYRIIDAYFIVIDE